LILAAAAGCGWVGPTEVGQQRTYRNESAIIAAAREKGDSVTLNSLYLN